MANIIGPDVSFYQDDPETTQGIDFVKMRQSTPFVIIRAGQNLWADPTFKYNWRESKLAGLARGSYWFYDSRVDPKSQAELWVEQFQGDFGELPLFADLEEDYNGPFKGWRNWYNFLERLKSLVGSKEIAIYTAYYYWRDNAPSPIFSPSNLEYFHQYPLWIANYNTQKPLVPKPWGGNEWLFWQFTDSGDGALYGVESGGIDLNYFNGDLEKFRARFNITEPPPPPPPPPPPDGTGIKHRVTATTLRVREGPGTNYAILTTVKFNDIVEEVGATNDRTWLKIKKSDGVVGWCFAQYLARVDGAPPPPPPTGTGKKYRVTVTTLRLREGPGTNFNIIANLKFDEIVEELDANSDRTWLRVKRSDGLIGWCASQYLLSIDVTPPPPPPPLENAVWYRVTTLNLTVYQGPALNTRKIGVLWKDDTIPSFETAPSDPNWIRIERVDGLNGWCQKNTLVYLGTEQPKSMRQRVFKCATYFRKQLSDPRNIVAHVLAINLQEGTLEFLVTPSYRPDGTLCTRKTSNFMREFNVHAAINGDGFNYIPTDPNDPVDVCDDADLVKPNGFAASRGRVYSQGPGPTVFINQRNVITFDKNKGSFFNAVSGDRIVLKDGKLPDNLRPNILNPRTAIGLSKNGRTVLFMVVDGRQTGYSEGVNYPELANLLISFGAHNGINMDGGGSSTLVIKGVDGKPRVLNTPIDQNIPGKERGVANHLGLIIRS